MNKKIFSISIFSLLLLGNTYGNKNHHNHKHNLRNINLIQYAESEGPTKVDYGENDEIVVTPLKE